jgi:hypothetical protein
MLTNILFVLRSRIFAAFFILNAGCEKCVEVDFNLKNRRYALFYRKWFKLKLKRIFPIFL